MKDIDFDELDRAVSSVLGQKVTDGAQTGATDSRGDANDSPSDISSEATTSPQSADESSQDTAATTETPESDREVTPSTPPAQAAPSTPLAVKRRGKFMDVMHPSADMKPSTPAASMTPRIAPVVEPLLGAGTPAPITEEPTEPTAELDETHSMIGAEPEPIESTLPEAATAPDEPTTGQREDTDTQQQTTAEEVTTDNEPSSTEENDQKASSDTEPTVDSDEQDQAGAVSVNDTPQTTPFLTDTQVEKRPLGAFGEADTGASDEATTTNEETSTLSPDTSDQSTTMQAAPAAALPRELQPDVVGVESVQATEAEEPSSPQAAPFATNVGPAAVSDDGRVEGHPLFDTSTYHEPIAAVPHKALPGWAMWAIGLAACLAVGAGVGYFLFTAGL